MKWLIFALGLAAFSAGAVADELSSALTTMCDKMKTCAMAQIEAENELPADMKAMMKQSLEQSCSTIQHNYEQAMQTYPGYYAAALACVRSMNKLDCQELMDEPGETQACKQYEAGVAQGG